MVGFAEDRMVVDPLQNYINSVLSTLPSQSPAGAYKGFDLAQILTDRPDVAAEGAHLRSIADPNSSWGVEHGVGPTNSPTDYARWWLDNYGINEGYTQNHAPTTPTTPSTPAPSTPANPTPIPDNPTTTTPGTGLGIPFGNSVSGISPAQALAQAQARARLAVQGRGLNYDDYSGELNGYLNDIFSTIPAGDTNASSYFDPNFADQILNGDQNKKRLTYKNQVNSEFSHPAIDRTSLDGIISKILGDNTQQATDMLNNGLKRGQFNEIGVQGGLSKLDLAKQKAKSKLNVAADDVFNGYDSQFKDVYQRALDAASSYQLGENFDISGYENEFGRLKDTATKNAEGELLQSIGDQPLINLADVRSGAGIAQGAVNLGNLDVLDALAKRKQASGVGRGLGSQGAF